MTLQSGKSVVSSEESLSKSSELLSEKPRPTTKPDLQRMLDIKKSYDFWQEVVRKNVQQQSAASSNLGSKAHGTKNGKAKGDKSKKENRSNSVFSSNGVDLFSESDIQFLRSRLDDIVLQNGLQLKDGEVDKLLESCVMEASLRQGFDPHGDQDEAGLCEGRLKHYDDESEAFGQDDYDVEELESQEKFSYDYGPTHHIEVELNNGPPGERRGSDEPSCEFTFEYDCNGKLIPTSTNIEEKLRLMNLQSRINNGGLAASDASGTKKKKKSSKKKKRHAPDDEHQCHGASDRSVCLFCEYKDVFGVEPLHAMNYFATKRDVTASDIVRDWGYKHKSRFYSPEETSKLVRMGDESGEPRHAR